MSYAKQKGTAAETAVVRYERKMLECGEDEIYRLPLHGTKDVGDVGWLYVAGLKCVQQVKSCKLIDYPQWVDAAMEQAGNADARWFVVIYKPAGLGMARVHDWGVVMPSWQWFEMVDALEAKDEVYQLWENSTNYRNGLGAWSARAQFKARQEGKRFSVVIHRRKQNAKHRDEWYATTTLGQFIALTQRL